MKTTNLLFFFLAIALSNVYCQVNRPQEPQAPYAYASEDITFENEVDSLMLAGTFTYPKTGTGFPVAILISGSGPQDRNSELLDHKPFLVMADHLTNHGIAVLRVDDRGTSESEGNYNETGIDGFVRDTKSAVAYLKTRKDVDQAKIGLIGHSLGGIIAPMVASESSEIAFIVLLAAPGMRGDELMLLQKERIERQMNVPEAGIMEGQKNIKGAYALILDSEGNKEELQRSLKTYFTEVYGDALPENQISMISNQLTIPWLVDLIKHDPVKSLAATKCSVLALNGSKDLQVPAKENIEAIEKHLKENGNTDFETYELENLNHLFQESETGLPAEYATIEQTFSPKALELMTNWILKKVK